MGKDKIPRDARMAAYFWRNLPYPWADPFGRYMAARRRQNLDQRRSPVGAFAEAINLKREPNDKSKDC